VSEEPELRTNPFHYNTDDLQALSLLVRPKWHRRLRIAGFVVIGMLALTLLIDLLLIPSDLELAPFVLGLIAAALLFLMSSSRLRPALWLRLIRRSPLYSEQSFALRDEGLFVDSVKYRTEIAWKGIVAVRRTDDRVFFFMGKRLAYIVPQRAFDSDAEFESFAAAGEQRWREAR